MKEESKVKTAEGILMANSFEIYQYEDDLCLKFTMEGAVKALQEYSNQKAVKMEAEQNKFKEALRDIIGSYKGHNFRDIIEIAEQALNKK